MNSVMPRKPIVILGSTGSIGTQALEVVAAHPNDFQILALAAGSNLELLAKQCAQYQVPWAGLSCPKDREQAGQVLTKVGAKEIFFGAEAAATICQNLPQLLSELGYPPQEVTVLNGVTGGVGLAATLATLKNDFTLALANKESLVVGGPLVRKALLRPGQVVPVDSEHSAIAQALLSGRHGKGLTVPTVDGISEVDQLILTASGGPFRGWKQSQLKNVTAQQALNHPTWKMGPVVTINSSTLMNKALELIEAHLLFDIEPERILPVVHPQSLVHSAVTWQDGSTVAQISPPDMKLPIALGLTWPKRLDTVSTRMDFTQLARMDFEPVDHATFPALQLASAALKASGTHPAVFNRANEVFVDAFLAGNLPYLGIVSGVEEVLLAHQGVADPDLADIMAAQDWATARAQELL